jgi:hypothetical protein
MDFEQVLHKASVVCLDGGRRIETHFFDVIKMVADNRLPGARSRNVKCAGLIEMFDRNCYYPACTRKRTCLYDVGHAKQGGRKFPSCF